MNFFKFLLVINCFMFFLHAEENSLNNGKQEYYSTITKAVKNNNWWDVIYYSKILLKQYPKNEIITDITFYLGQAYFYVEHFEVANKYLSEYLTVEFSPKYYEEAISYKFQIAKRYFEGYKKAVFGARKLPHIIPSKEDALKIFEEVINAMPNSDMAIQSLFFKGKLHADLEDYKESIDAFQEIIRKYPKHEYAIESFLEIEAVYLKQADPKHQDPNLLDLAKINLKRFKEAFPKEERILEAEENYKKIEEIYAKGLYEIGQFYERTKKTEASAIYYQKIIALYPETACAKLSQSKLVKLNINK